MAVQQLAQRQLFTMKRKSLEKRIIKYYEATRDSSAVIEYAVAILVRNALVVGDFSLMCQELIRELFLTAEVSPTLRQFCPYFKDYFNGKEWNQVMGRLFKNKKAYHRLNEEIRENRKYLSSSTRPSDSATSGCHLVSVFKDSNGKRHTWTLRDVEPNISTTATRNLLKILTTLTIFKTEEVRRFAALVKFDRLVNTLHYEEAQEVLIDERPSQEGTTEVEQDISETVAIETGSHKEVGQSQNESMGAADSAKHTENLGETEVTPPIETEKKKQKKKKRLTDKAFYIQTLIGNRRKQKKSG